MTEKSPVETIVREMNQKVAKLMKVLFKHIRHLIIFGMMYCFF
jgi:hypothetical protein